MELSEERRPPILEARACRRSSKSLSTARLFLAGLLFSRSFVAPTAWGLDFYVSPTGTTSTATGDRDDHEPVGAADGAGAAFGGASRGHDLAAGRDVHGRVHELSDGDVASRRSWCGSIRESGRRSTAESGGSRRQRRYRVVRVARTPGSGGSRSDSTLDDEAISQNGSARHTDLARGSGGDHRTGYRSPGLKLINLVDPRPGGKGSASGSGATDTRGLRKPHLLQRVGRATDRGHGHGIYTQNQTGTKTFTDNIMFNSYGDGLIIAYGSDDGVPRQHHGRTGTSISDNGSPSRFGAFGNLLFGGDRSLRSTGYF